MTPAPPRHPCRRFVAATLVVLAFPAAAALDVALGLGGLLLGATVGLAVPVGIWLGPAGVVAVTTGMVLRAIVLRIDSSVALLGAATGGAVTLLTFVLWTYGLKPSPAVARSRDTRLWKRLGKRIVVGMTAIVGGAAFYGTAAVATNWVPFYIAFSSTVAQYVIATLVLVPFVTPVFGWALGSSTSGHPIQRPTHDDYSSPLDSAYTPRFGWPRGALLAVPYVWGLFGTIGSVGFRFGRRVVNEDSPVVFRWILDPELVGHGGRRAQLLLGATMLTTIGLTVVELRRREDRGEHRWN